MQGEENTCSQSIPRAGWLLPNGRGVIHRPFSAASGKFGERSTGPVERCGLRRLPRRAAGAGSELRGGSPRARRRRPLGSASARGARPRPSSSITTTSSISPAAFSSTSTTDGLVEHDSVVDELPFALVDRAGRRGCRCGGCRLGRLGGLHRGELFLGRQLATLGHDHQLDLGRDALEQVDRHRVAADPLDVVDADLAAVDADLADAPDLVGDVGRRDRAEERAGRAGLDVEPQDELAERLGDLVGLFGAARLVHRLLGVDALDLLDPSLRRDLGEVARQQEVAGVPAGDVDDLATQAELLHVFEQDHVHQTLLARDVGQERDLAGPLDRHGDLPLMAAARAGDAAVADLALLGDVAP